MITMENTFQTDYLDQTDPNVSKKTLINFRREFNAIFYHIYVLFNIRVKHRAILFD